MPANNTPLTYAEVIAQLQSGGQISAELVEIFSEEAAEHVRTIYDGLDRLRVNRGDGPALGDVRRASHTLKGAAAAVGMEVVTRLAHRMEDLLDYLADHNLTTTEAQIGLLLSTADQLEDLTTTKVDPDTTATALVEIYENYAREMTELTAGNDSSIDPVASSPAELPAEVETESAELDESAESTDLDDEETVLAEVHKLREEALADSNDDTSGDKPERSETNVRSETNAQPTQYLRVPLDRLDDLVKLVGEMIVNRSAFHQRLADFESRIDDMNTAVGRFRSVVHDVETRYSVDALRVRSTGRLGSGNATEGLGHGAISSTNDMDSLEFDRYTDFHLLARTLSETTNDVSMVTGEFKNLLGDFDSLLGRQQRLNRDAQDGLMHIRMVPVGNIVNRLDRTVRSVANKLSKKVNLVVVGEQTELDKTVLEEIADPLQHLIRNAIDHGVESAEERIAAGKPATSQLTIEALNQGTQVTIRVSDDGRGINVQKVRQLAIEKGLIEEGKELSEEELHALLFAPGFSTADTLTDVSGRGVGMDVVREAVQRLRGSIRVDSELGKGATFTIHLPTTLAVSRALLVQTSGQTFAIPMQSVQQILRLDPSDVGTVGKKPIVRIGDQSVQLKNLGNHLQLTPDEHVDFSQSVPLLLLQDGDDEIAVTIDSIESSQDIVVKTLGDHLRHVPGLLGATVRGDGSVISILDPADIAGKLGGVGKRFDNSRYASKAQAARRNLAMVVDDSISVRRVTAGLLRSAGWDVIDAKDGIDALEQLSSMDDLPNVFLTDMEMPRMNGIELINRLRNQPKFADLPILMVTSRASSKHRTMALDAGADEHIVKPFNDERLIEMINRYATLDRQTANV